MFPAVTPWHAAFLGLFAGMVCGALARRAHLCSFGAIEDAVTAGDTRRLKAFAWALAVALALTQSLIGSELLRTADMTLLPPVLPWAGALVGGGLFGLGMALVGTCGFGALVRLGGGDLRAAAVLPIYGAVAWATATGQLALLRIRLLDPFAIRLAGGGGTDLPAMLLASVPRGWIGGIVALALAAWTLSDRRVRRSSRLMAVGTALGLCVAFGWFVTGVLFDPFEGVPHPQGLSFVTPVARLLQALVLEPGPAPQFGMGTAVGVALGALLAAWRNGDLRWEAFDDTREMRRHMIGACLMGFGGISAGGCTIGQGLSAGSVLAPSWAFAVGGIFLGARVGIATLVGGAPLWSQPSWTSWFRGK